MNLLVLLPVAPSHSVCVGPCVRPAQQRYNIITMVERTLYLAVYMSHEVVVAAAAAEEKEAAKSADQEQLVSGYTLNLPVNCC